MKNKILFGVNSFFLAAVLTSLFLPIDGIYMYAINWALGVLSFIFILVTFCIKREKQFLFLSLLQLATLSVVCVYIVCRRYYSSYYSPYRIGWKLYVCFLILPIAFSHFLLARQIFPKKRALCCFLVLLSFIFVKVVFFTQFYEFEGNKEDGDDIRNYPEFRQYKVLNRRKLKNSKPEKLVDEDFSAIASLLNNSDWLKDSYPECVGDFPDYVDISYIKKHIRYSFSVLCCFNFSEADFYKISIPLKTSRKKANVYFPKGKFGLYKESLEAYKKYYGVSPKEISYYYYEGLGLPYNQDEYESYIED